MHDIKPQLRQMWDSDSTNYASLEYILNQVEMGVMLCSSCNLLVCYLVSSLLSEGQTLTVHSEKTPLSLIPFPLFYNFPYLVFLGFVPEDQTYLSWISSFL